MRFEVLRAVKMSMLVLSPENEGSMFLRNITYVQDHSAPQLKRTTPEEKCLISE
jgi:hypothetical protein